MGTNVTMGPTPIAWPDDIQAQGRLLRVGTPEPDYPTIPFHSVS